MEEMRWLWRQLQWMEQVLMENFSRARKTSCQGKKYLWKSILLICWNWISQENHDSFSSLLIYLSFIYLLSIRRWNPLIWLWTFWIIMMFVVRKSGYNELNSKWKATTIRLWSRKWRKRKRRRLKSCKKSE